MHTARLSQAQPFDMNSITCAGVDRCLVPSGNVFPGINILANNNNNNNCDRFVILLSYTPVTPPHTHHETRSYLTVDVWPASEVVQYVPIGTVGHWEMNRGGREKTAFISRPPTPPPKRYAKFPSISQQYIHNCIPMGGPMDPMYRPHVMDLGFIIVRYSKTST